MKFDCGKKYEVKVVTNAENFAELVISEKVEKAVEGVGITFQHFPKELLESIKKLTKCSDVVAKTILGNFLDFHQLCYIEQFNKGFNAGFKKCAEDHKVVKSKIECIKIVRNKFGISLIDAKHVVDEMFP